MDTTEKANNYTSDQVRLIAIKAFEAGADWGYSAECYGKDCGREFCIIHSEYDPNNIPDLIIDKLLADFND